MWLGFFYRGRRVRKIEVPTYTPTEFEFGYRAADIQRRRLEREAREREEDAQKQTGEARKEETINSAEAENHGKTDRSGTERDTGGREELSTSQSLSMHK